MQTDHLTSPSLTFSRFPLFLGLSLILVFGVGACGGAAPTPGLETPTAGGSPALPLTGDREILTVTPTPVPPTRTPAPTSTATITPTPTPTPHPLTITWLRDQSFPGSEVTIEETLEPGPNYNRHIASYRSEGLKIFALLTVPYGERPESGWPVIIFNHGYIPPEQYRTTDRYVAYVDGFARSGYIVFRSDYRGHGFSEGQARGGYGSPDYTVDILNAIETMKNYPEADPERVGMWGHSMGGYITLRSMVASEDIKAGVIWAGVVASYPDLLERWTRRAGSSDAPPSRPRSWRVTLAETFGTPEENPIFWDSISANSYLEDLSGPVQLHHGTGDTHVPIEFSASLNEQIQAAGRLVEYYEYQGDDHNLSNAFSLAMGRSIAFFDQHVKTP
jgi:dienelactone hydrolase